MKRLSRLFSSKILFFLISSLIILSLNLTPLIVFRFQRQPQGRSFAYIHNNTQDFFFYLSLMNEGANGEWLTTNPYTTEPHQPSIIFTYFLWLGKLSQLLRLSYPLTYHLIRITLSLLLFFTVYRLLLTVKIPYPNLAFIFFLFASPFMHKVIDGGKLTTVPYMFWWTGMDAARRAAYLPHHLFGGILLVLTVILIIGYINTKNTKYIVWSSILTLPMAFVHPPSLFIILIVLLITTIVSLLTHQLRFNYVLGLLIYWFIGLLVLLLMVSQTSKGFPWSQYLSWEKNLQFPLEWELIPALGILFPLAVLGAIKLLLKGRFSDSFIISWLFVPLAIIPFAKKLNLSNIRFIQGLPYLPLAILATVGIETLQNLEFRIKRFKYIKLLGYLFIGLLFLYFTIPTLVWSLKDQIREYWPIYGNVYIDNRLFKAFDFINKNFPPKSITLATFYTGNYLPSFTNTTSFIGHFGYTYNIDSKQKLVEKFFTNKMAEEEAKDFLTNNKIALIFQGPEEKPIYNSYLYPNLLKSVYDKEEATIYVLKTVPSL